MIKFSFRNNNFYPLMLLLFIFLRICVDKILQFHPYQENMDFVLSFLIFFSQCLIGCIIHLYNYCNKNKNLEKSRKDSLAKAKIGTIYLIMNKSYKSNDSKYKIFILIFFTSFFNFIGSIVRTNDIIKIRKNEESNSQLEVRIGSMQIIIASLLCHYTIRLNIYKHQKLSLIVVSFFLFLLIVAELIAYKDIKIKILSMLICLLSCLSRAFMDVTEKYLFDLNYINIFSMLIYEGLIGIIFFVFFFFSDKNYQKHGINILKNISESGIPLLSFIILIIFYTIISGFRNAYRVTTNKYYSPMSRALFESSLDPFVFVYNFLIIKNNNISKEAWIYFGFVIFSLSVIAFFSLVYNDFIILYCCGLEYNTYSEINKRIDKIKKIDKVNNSNNSILDDSSSLNTEEANTEGNLELGNLE